MSHGPVRPEDIIVMTPSRIDAIDALLKKHYYPSVGFVELNVSSFEPIMNLHSLSDKWALIWEDIRDAYARAGWTVTFHTSTGIMAKTFLRFERTIKEED